VVAVAGDAFDGGFQQGDDPLFAAGVGGRTGHPDGLGLLGFHQEHQIERWRGFAGGGLHQQLIADELDFVVEGRVRLIGLGGGGFEDEEPEGIVYQESDGNEIEAFADFLHFINDHFGPSTSRYSPKRIRITIEPGDKREGDSTLPEV
jgi:hypothetical protein